MKSLIKQILLEEFNNSNKILNEIIINKNDYYPYENRGNIFFFKDEYGNKNLLQLIDRKDGGVYIKFGVSNIKNNISPGVQTRIKDPKVFNTYLKILFDDILINRKYLYVEYKPINEDGTYDDRRERLYQIGINKYIQNTDWGLNQYGETWKIEK
jgi:hypothetical protein